MKSQNSFESTNITSIYRNGVSFKVYQLRFKKPPLIWILHDSKGNQSDFFDIICKRQKKITLWRRKRSYWIRSITEISTYQQQLRRSSFQQYFSSHVVNCPLVSGSYYLNEAELYFKRHEPKKELKVVNFQKQSFVDVLLNRYSLNFAKFTEIFMCRIPFLTKLQVWGRQLY